MTQYTVTLNSPNQYSVTTNTEQLQLSLSRTGPQGTKGDSVSSAYIDLNGDFHVVIVNAAGDTVTDINLGGENYIASAVAAEAAALAAQTAAESAQTAAETALDTLDDVFLGPKSSAPTLDNDGDPLTEGALYWNTTTNELGVYEGSAWEYPAQEARTYSISAAASASSASTSATNAATSEINSAASAFASSTSAAAALQDAIDAGQASADSQYYAGQANTSASEAATSESNAATSETNAGNSATTAAASASLSQTKAAESYNSAVSALNSKNAAATSEINAAGSALDSFNYSQAALASKNAAATSEISALNSKTAAAASAAAALVSEADALTAASESATSATASSASATAASNSATAALASETASATSETNAAASETAAGLSEVASANSAVAAALSETNAATSEANAASSATLAVNSATAAATSETNAGLSAVASANSAIAAALSETASATSETAAAGSAASAASDLASVQAIFDQFDDRYLGAYATDPTTDNDGNPLIAGTVYWNTTDSVLKFYNGAAWEAPSASAATSAANALASEQAAATSASNASSSETASALSASAALASETASATSEANAASSEATASTAASAALASETAAATSEINAASSASSSSTSATASAASASAALASETASAASETASATSETNAASSALAASNSETSAAASSTSAGNSATAALASETAAATSETNAASSALASANSATASATSASNSNTSALASASSASAASASETAASGSASAASSSAAAAATSETNAASSEANASTSETNAASSAASAAASYDSFDDRYLGAKASAPTVDNDGGALLLGALYWNTTSNNMYVWEGSLWKQATGSIEGIREEFVFTSTAGQTVFSGLDDNGLTLVMDALELVDVFLNGIKIVKGIDYTLDILNNTVTFASGRTLNDIVSVHSFGNFTASTNSLNIVGGSVNGSPIGNTTADSGTFTNLTATGTTSVGTITGTSLTATQSATLQQAGSTKLQTTTTGVDVTGTVTADGLVVDGSASVITLNNTDTSLTLGQTLAKIDVYQNDPSDQGVGVVASIEVENRGSIQGLGQFNFKTGSATSLLDRLSIADNGDISFYEDTGTTPKFFWDASAESLGIGTTLPDAGLTVIGDAHLKATSGYSSLYFNGITTGSARYAAIKKNFDSPFDLSINASSSGSGAPLIFNSSSAIEAMRIDSSGNVGIGTNSPSDTLSVVNLGSSGTGTQISSGTSSGDLRFKARTESYNGIVSVYDSGSNEDVRISAHSGVSTYFNSGSNVGIGTSSPSTRLHVNSGVYDTIATFESGDRYGTLKLKDSTSTASTGGVTLGVDGDALYVQTGSVNSNAMRINSNGNVGIGTSSPSVKAHIAGSLPYTYIDNSTATSGTYGLKLTAGATPLADFTYSSATGENRIGGLQSYVFPTFYSGGSERMRIDSSGNVMVGTTNPGLSVVGTTLLPSGRTLSVTASGAMFSTRHLTTNGVIAEFLNTGGNTIGSISQNGTTTAYNTSSDYRLKENVTAVQGASDIIKAMRPVTYTYKSDGSWMDGFLAHELQELHPVAVSGSKDAMKDEEYEVTPAVEATYDAEGVELTPAVPAVMGTRSVPDYQGVDYSKLTPILTAALQEALNKIDALEARLTALEAV